MKRLLLIVVGGAAFVGALWGGWTFRAQNSASTDLDLIWIRIPNLELWWLLLMATAFGAIMATLFVGFSLLRNKLLLRRSRAQVRKLEKEVHELRSLPLVGSEPTGEELDQSIDIDSASNGFEKGANSAPDVPADVATPALEKS